MPPVLLDTGPFVALLDSRDSQHQPCKAAFAQVKSPLLTTEAVLTETLYLLGNFSAQEVALTFLLRGAVILVPTDASATVSILSLMKKYADVPMDYADATLVHLAQEVGTTIVFTLDRRGFATYRINKRVAFTLLP